MTDLRLLLSSVASLGMLLAVPASAVAASCESLASLSLPNITVTAAQTIPAGDYTAANGQTFTPFSVEGPDPGHGNLLLGGGIATTTGAWSIGLSYDYLKSDHGPSEQSGVLTLVGRI